MIPRKTLHGCMPSSQRQKSWIHLWPRDHKWAQDPWHCEDGVYAYSCKMKCQKLFSHYLDIQKVMLEKIISIVDVMNSVSLAHFNNDKVWIWEYLYPPDSGCKSFHISTLFPLGFYNIKHISNDPNKKKRDMLQFRVIITGFMYLDIQGYVLINWHQFFVQCQNTHQYWKTK